MSGVFFADVHDRDVVCDHDRDVVYDHHRDRVYDVSIRSFRKGPLPFRNGFPPSVQHSLHYVSLCRVSRAMHNTTVLICVVVF